MIVPGCQFASDNTAGVCPEAWQAMTAANAGYASPYGNDQWTARAIDLLRDIFECKCEVFFTYNGTAANSLALAAICQSYHCVLAHESSHIETDECGGPEFFSNGTKLLAVPGDHGCVDVDAVEKIAQRRTDVHFPKAKVLSITQSTELGTVYDQAALDRVHETTRRLELNLHMDGARFANALATLNTAAKEITWKRGVDVICLGGTKNGMAVGDCVVFFDLELAKEFAYRCKQAGQLASKMRYLAAPWVGMLSSGSWLNNARHANMMARTLADRLQTFPGIDVASPVQSNAVFVDFPVEVKEQLRAMNWEFYDLIGSTSRLMCSWQTTAEEVGAFVDSVQNSLATATE